MDVAKPGPICKKIGLRHKYSRICLFISEYDFIFAVFFMVLDLRLVKIGCRETINFFVSSPEYLTYNWPMESL